MQWHPSQQAMTHAVCGVSTSWYVGDITASKQIAVADMRVANNESSEVIDILLPVTFLFYPSTRLDNVKNLWRFAISMRVSWFPHPAHR